MQPKWLAWITALALTTALAPTGTAAEDPAPTLVEVQPNPPGADDGNEWIELSNPTPVPLPLDGLYVADRDGCFASGVGFTEDHRWALDGSIPPRSHLALTIPSPGNCNQLANGGDRLYLETEDGDTLQSVGYGDEGALAIPSPQESLTACSLGPLHPTWTIAPASQDAANPTCSPT